MIIQKDTRMMMIVGEEKTYKTTLALQIALGSIKSIGGADIIHFDFDGSMTIDRFKEIRGSEYIDDYTLIKDSIDPTFIENLYNKKMINTTDQVIPTIVILDDIDKMLDSLFGEYDILDTDMVISRHRYILSFLREIHKYIQSGHIRVILVSNTSDPIPLMCVPGIPIPESGHIFPHIMPTIESGYAPMLMSDHIMQVVINNDNTMDLKTIKIHGISRPKYKLLIDPNKNILIKGEIEVEKLNTIQKREKLNIVSAVDEKGNGGANHLYVIQKDELVNEETLEHEVITLSRIQFQEGPRKEEDSIHGVLDTDLLEIVRHRLQCFQEGEFATRENAIALTHIEEALLWMNMRIENRIERGVLGTYEK